MSDKYYLQQADLDSKWDNFINSSLYQSAFLSSDFLLALKNKLVAYYCYKNKTIKAGFVLVKKNNHEVALHDFLIYNGIVFTKPLKEQNIAQIGSEQFRVLNCIADNLPLMYKKIELSLSPSILDIRPFSWYNYGKPNTKYEVEVRFTSYLWIKNFYKYESLDENILYKNCSYSRRQEIRYGIKNKVKTKEHFDFEKFVDFYISTMLRQGIETNEKSIMEMKNLLKRLNETKKGRMFMSYTIDGSIGSMAFFLVEPKKAYLLFLANNPVMRNTQTGTMVLWDAFSILSRSNIQEIDLEGVNSPKRGWFKLSFGGNIKPYFHIRYNNKT